MALSHRSHAPLTFILAGLLALLLLAPSGLPVAAQAENPAPTLIAEAPVDTARISPDGRYAIYLSQNRLFSVPFAGGEPTPLSPAGSGVGFFQFAPDSTSVLFLSGSPQLLVAVPVTGGTPRPLSGALPAGQSVIRYEATADGTRVVFQTDRGNLSVVPLAGGAPRQINAALAAGEQISHWQLTPGGSRVVYAVHQPDAPDTPGTLYSAALAGGAPTSLDSTYRSTLPTGFALSADGARVLYPRQGSAPQLASAPTAGGAATPVATPALNELLEASVAGNRAVFSGRGDDFATRIYSAPLSGAGGAVELSAGKPAGSSVNSHRVSADGARVVFHVQLPSGQGALVSAPAAGGAAATIAPAPTQFGGPGIGYTFLLSPDSARIVYYDSGALRSAPITGGAPVSIASDLSFPAGSLDPFNFVFSADGTRLFFRAGLRSDSGRAPLFVTEVAEAGEATVLSGDVAVVAGPPLQRDLGFRSFAVSAAGDRVIFRGAADATDDRALYAVSASSTELLYLPLLAR